MKIGRVPGPDTPRVSCQEAIWLRHSPHGRLKGENHDILIARLVANGDSPTIVSYNGTSELISRALPWMIRGSAVTEDD
jgi:hypothetical protein